MMENIGYISGRLCALISFLHDACKNEFGMVGDVEFCCDQPLRMDAQLNSAISICIKKMPEYDMLMQEIVGLLPPDGLPKRLGPEDKERFMIGYDHQRLALKSWRVSIGNRIMELRAEKGLSQQGLADAAGMNKSNINRIENGRYSVSVDILARIAMALGVEMREMF